MIPSSQHFSFVLNSSIIIINLLTSATIISTFCINAKSLKHLPPVLFSSKHSTTTAKVVFLKWKDDVYSFLKCLHWLLGLSRLR